MISCEKKKEICKEFKNFYEIHDSLTQIDCKVLVKHIPFYFQFTNH